MKKYAVVLELTIPEECVNNEEITDVYDIYIANRKESHHISQKDRRVAITHVHRIFEQMGMSEVERNKAIDDLEYYFGHARREDYRNVVNGITVEAYIERVGLTKQIRAIVDAKEEAGIVARHAIRANQFIGSVVIEEVNMNNIIVEEKYEVKLINEFYKDHIQCLSLDSMYARLQENKNHIESSEDIVATIREYAKRREHTNWVHDFDDDGIILRVYHAVSYEFKKEWAF